PSRFIPSATAPELTRTTSLPSARRRATCVAQRAIAASSRPRPSSVTSVEPILTTMRRASRTAPSCRSTGTPTGRSVRFFAPSAMPVPVPARIAIERSAANAILRLGSIAVERFEAHVAFRRLLRAHRVEPVGDREAEPLAALAREGRDREHALDRDRVAAATAISRNEGVDALLPLARVDHVDLVQHEPARLF